MGVCPWACVSPESCPRMGAGSEEEGEEKGRVGGRDHDVWGLSMLVLSVLRIRFLYQGVSDRKAHRKTHTDRQTRRQIINISSN